MADLITLDCYKENRDINSTTRDGKIQTLIAQVSALIENYCSRQFTAYSVTPKVEWFDAKTSSVTLTLFPIISVDSVATSDDGGVTQTVLTEGASDKSGYFVDLENCEVIKQRSIDNFLDTYDTPFRSLEVTYKAGYIVDNIPEDLKLCTIDLVSYYLDSEKEPSKSLFGASIENPQPYIASSFPPHIRRILDLYRYSP